MRTIVKAVGLICILAHDYLIVKIKMLFRDPVAVIDNQLSEMRVNPQFCVNA